MVATAIPGHDRYRHLALTRVDSTNAVALEAGREGDAGNLWVTAEQQRKGRGRHGRAWISETGNLYASLLLVEKRARPERFSTLPFAAACAVHRTLAPFFADRPMRPSIKWPNDILVHGKKIAGILLESEPLSAQHNAIVIGCGINCAHHPENLLYPATDLSESGVFVQPGQLFPLLVSNMDAMLVLWDDGEGFEQVRQEWLSAAQGVGERVSVNLAREQKVAGTFSAIDEKGCLLLTREDGETMKISAGDLFFSSPDDAAHG